MATWICDLCVPPSVGGGAPPRDSGHGPVVPGAQPLLAARRHPAARGKRYLLRIQPHPLPPPPIGRIAHSAHECWCHFSPGSFKGSICTIGYFGGSGLLPALLGLSFKQNLPRTCLADPQFLPRKREPRGSPNVSSQHPGCFDWFLLKSVLWPGNRSLQLVSACTRLGPWGDGLAEVGMRLVVAIGTDWPVSKGQMSTSRVLVLLPGHLCQSIQQSQQSL